MPHIKPLPAPAGLSAGGRPGLRSYSPSESEARFRGAFDFVATGMAIVGLDGRLLQVNRALCEMLGYSEEELLQADFQSLTHPDDLEKDLQQVDSLLAGRQTFYRLEKRYRHSSGSTVWGMLSCTAVRDSSSRPAYFLGQVQDITEQKTVFEALLQSEKQYRTLAENIPQLVWIIDAEGRVTYVNERLREYVGRDLVQERWPNWKRLVHPDDRSSTLHRWRAALKTRAACEVECRLRSFNGEYRWHIVRAVPMEDGNHVLRWLGASTDIHAHKLAEDALLVSERRFRAILEKSFDCIELTSAAGVVEYASSSIAAILGESPGQLAGRILFDSLHPEDVSSFRERFDRLVDSPHHPLLSTHRRRHRDGTYRWLEARGTNLLHDADVGAIVFNFRDVTQEKLAEETQHKLRLERDALLRRLQVQVEQMPIGLILTDRDARIVDWNPAAERIFGLTKSEVLGRPLASLKILPREALPDFAQAAIRVPPSAASRGCSIECTTTFKRTILCEWFNTPLRSEDGTFNGMLSMVIDATEKRDLEDQYRQAQKMEAVGTLAGGVAHDFNNLLTVINGNSEILMDELAPESDACELVAEIQRAGEQAASLTDQLLSFSRRQVLCRELIDLNVVVADMQSMLARMIGEDVALTTDLRPLLPSVRMDRNQLEQVVMNLAVNARDAMPRGGKFCVSTRKVFLQNKIANDGADVREGTYVRLTVSDTGVGIDGGDITHIFEPFYTTKEVGRGTGLGLATVYGIVKQAEGHIEVSSRANCGTRFDIFLPAVEEPAEAASPASQSRVARGNGEMILVVEDEDALRAVAERMLLKLGYKVIVAASGQEALQIGQQCLNDISLLITDVVMPGVGGSELYQRFEALRPDLRVVYMSGHTTDRVVEHGVSDAEAFFLKKPFTRESLSECIQEALSNS